MWLNFIYNNIWVFLTLNSNSVSARFWNIQDNCQFYQNSLIIKIIFYQLLRVNLTNTLHCLGSSWSWLYGSSISNYMCNQCNSPLMLWVRTPLRCSVFDTTLCDKACQWLATDQWVSPGTPVSSTNKSGRHDITEILLKVALNIINHQPTTLQCSNHNAARTVPQVVDMLWTFDEGCQVTSLKACQSC